MHLGEDKEHGTVAEHDGESEERAAEVHDLTSRFPRWMGRCLTETIPLSWMQSRKGCGSGWPLARW